MLCRHTVLAILGGSGDNGGDGGGVSVSSSGPLQSSGAISHGILAQSVAGSGGPGDIPVGLTLGLGGSCGNGGAVSVSNFGTILTEGYGSKGTIAQSISGGGVDAATLGGDKLTIGVRAAASVGYSTSRALLTPHADASRLRSPRGRR